MAEDSEKSFPFNIDASGNVEVLKIIKPSQNVLSAHMMIINCIVLFYQT